MPRPRSQERRQAILAAATRVIADQGLGAATATIAREAGVSNGSLFSYFDTKTTLVNDLFVTLKSEMGVVAADGLPEDGPLRDRLRHMWDQWLRWATGCPEKRRALAHLTVADEIRPESHRAVGAAFGPVVVLLEQCKAGGPMRDVPLGFVLTLASAISDATIDAILASPQDLDALSQVAFDAVWRVIAGTPSGKDAP